MVAFLYSTDEILEKEYKNTIPFKIAPQKIKYLGMYLTKKVKDLNIGQDTIKLPEENKRKTFSDINLTNVFSGQSPKTTEIKAK